MRSLRSGAHSQVPRAGTDIARGTDPETSKAAAESITTSGARRTQKQRIYDAAIAHPGVSRRDLAGYTKMTEYQVSKRLSDLVNEHLLAYGAARDGQQTVYPTSAQQRAARSNRGHAGRGDDGARELGRATQAADGPGRPAKVWRLV